MSVVDITKWHVGNPTKPGLWWTRVGGKLTILRRYDQQDIYHANIWNSDGFECAFVEFIPEPKEQS